MDRWAEFKFPAGANYYYWDGLHHGGVEAAVILRLLMMLFVVDVLQ